MESYKAIRIGLILVISSAFVFMLIGLGFGIVLWTKFQFHISFIIVFLIISMIIYSPFWSLILLKWQIWSLKRIYDFEIFIELAQKRALFYPQDHFYSKYAIGIKKDKKLLKDLLLKGQNTKKLELLRRKYENQTIVFHQKLSRLFNSSSILEISIIGIKLREEGLIKWADINYVMAKTSGGKYPEHWIEYSIKNSNRKKIYKLRNINSGFLKVEYFINLYKQLARTQGV
jgi:hypothetical protein